MAPVNRKTILLASFLGVGVPLLLHGCGDADGPRDDPQDDPSDDPNEPVPDPDVPAKIELPDWIASLNCTIVYDTIDRIFVKPRDDGGGFTKADITTGLPSLLASLDFDPIGRLIAWLLQMGFSSEGGPWPLIEQYIPTMYKYFIDNLNDNTFQSIIVFVWTPFVNAVNDQTLTDDGNETTGDVILREFNTAVQAVYNSTDFPLGEFLDVCKEEYFSVFSVYADVFLRSVGGFPQWAPRDVIDGLDCNKTNALLWLYTDTSKYPSDNCYISSVTLPGDAGKAPEDVPANSTLAVLDVLPADVGSGEVEEERVFSYLETDFTPPGASEDAIPVVQSAALQRAPGLSKYVQSRVKEVTITDEAGKTTTTSTPTIKSLTDLCGPDNATKCDKASFKLFGKFVGASYSPEEDRLVVTPGYENDNCAGDWPGNGKDIWEDFMPQALKAFYFGEYPKLRTILKDNVLDENELDQVEAAGALNVTATMTSDEIDKNVHTAIEKLWSEQINDKLDDCSYWDCPEENALCCYEDLSESDLWAFPRKPTTNKFEPVRKEEYMLHRLNMELNKLLDELISLTGEVKNDTDYTCKPDDIAKLQTTLTEEWDKATPSYPKPLEPEEGDGEDEEGDGKEGDRKAPAKKMQIEAL